MDFVLESPRLEIRHETTLQGLRRSLANARKRARYWGALPILFRASNSVSPRVSRSRALHFQEAINEFNRCRGEIAKRTGRWPVALDLKHESERPLPLGDD